MGHDDDAYDDEDDDDDNGDHEYDDNDNDGDDEDNDDDDDHADSDGAHHENEHDNQCKGITVAKDSRPREARPKNLVCIHLDRCIVYSATFSGNFGGVF